MSLSSYVVITGPVFGSFCTIPTAYRNFASVRASASLAGALRYCMLFERGRLLCNELGPGIDPPAVAAVADVAEMGVGCGGEVAV